MPSILVSFLALLVSATPEASEPLRVPVGSRVADFAGVDRDGKTRHLTDWGGSRLVVIVFIRPGCPVAELYGDTLGRLAEALGPRGVAFVGVATAVPDEPAELGRFAAAHSIRFPILADEPAEIAAALGVGRTPEAVVLDERRAIRYRGRIDDQYAVGSRKPSAGRRDLVDAVEQLLAGKAVSRPETEAVGCTIDRPRRRPAQAAVTYSRDIAPILNRRCVRCHRPGQVGPFALTDYTRARRWAGPMVEAIEDGRMPPWHADPRYGRFANDARLSDREKALIEAWVEGGMPEGDTAELPPPAPVDDGWNIRKPDLVIAMPRPFAVPAQGSSNIRASRSTPA